MLILYLIFIVAPICIFLHELGHALGARTVKAKQVTVQMGIGNFCKIFQVGTIYFTFYPLYFFGGLVKSKRDKPYSPFELIWITICGPLSSGVFAIFFYVLAKYAPNVYIQLFIYFNTWLAIMNLIPFKLKDKQSDGYTIIQTLFSK